MSKSGEIRDLLIRISSRANWLANQKPGQWRDEDLMSVVKLSSELLQVWLKGKTDE